jgi:hypothetical protein
VWYINFGKYLDNLGFENGALAWELSTMTDLEPEDHDNIIRLITKEEL